MYFIRKIKLIIIGIIVFGCDYINTNIVSGEEIKLASSWSIDDQPPSFDECQGLIDLIDQKECFENKIISLIYEGLNSLNLKTSDPFDSEIILVIKVDETGSFSIDKIDDLDRVLSKFINLETKIRDIINNLPKALPAIKTNVGSYVNVKFYLPINIKAAIAK